MGFAGHKRCWAMLLVALVAGRVASAAPGADSAAEYERWLPLLRSVAARGGEVDDLYKLVHQGTMGPAHAVTDPEAALQWLTREWEEMGGLAALTDSAAASWLPDVPALEPIRPDGRLVRVHLRPLLGLLTRDVPAASRAEVVHLALERLAVAFKRTADDWRGDLGELRLVWERAAADSTLWARGSGARRRADFTEEVRQAGWPAVHHSEAYRRRADPHYRVVAVAHLPASWRAVAGEETNAR